MCALFCCSAPVCVHRSPTQHWPAPACAAHWWTRGDWHELHVGWCEGQIHHDRRRTAVPRVSRDSRCFCSCSRIVACCFMLWTTADRAAQFDASQSKVAILITLLLLEGHFGFVAACPVCAAGLLINLKLTAHAKLVDNCCGSLHSRCGRVIWPSA